MPRTLAIGDIHGCSVALAALLKAIDPQPEDTIITLGDYVDRGIDSKGVLDQLLELRSRCKLIPLRGNHDAMMLEAFEDKAAFRFWSEMGGGLATLDSYGDSGQLDQVPIEHREFLKSCRLYYETPTHFFVHANYSPALPLAQQDDRVLLWLSLRDYVPGPHCSGKIAVVGHTPQMSGEILDIGHLVCLDTGCAEEAYCRAWMWRAGRCGRWMRKAG